MFVYFYKLRKYNLSICLSSHLIFEVYFEIQICCMLNIHLEHLRLILVDVSKCWMKMWGNTISVLKNGKNQK